MADYTIVRDSDPGDYYLGRWEYLFRNGILIWEGSSGDVLESIVKAVVGEDHLLVVEQ